MMFSAGMGIGLMFYGVGEPLSHMAAPPNGAAKPNTPEAAEVAMEYSYFHWALHPWAIYAVVGLALAYFVHRKGAPNLISSAFRPLIGDRVEGPIGRGIDGLAIFATLFGSATSLGLGALQINSGMDFLWGVEPSNGLAVAIIAALTAMFIVSAVSGVHRGVQWLSNGNMVLAVLLLTFLLVVGPTVFIFDTLAASVGGYVSSIVPRSFQTGAFGDQEWLAGWTIFYWAWWISWAPFVGTFIARISQRAHDRRVRPRRARDPERRVVRVVRHPRRLGDRPPARRHRHRLRGLAGAGDRAVHDAGAVPALGPDVVRRDRARRAVLHQRRGRGLARDGHAVLARRAEPAAVDDDLLGRRHRRRPRRSCCSPAGSRRSSRRRSSPRPRSCS